METRRSEAFAWRLERDGGRTEGRSEEGGECAAERVPDDPDGRVRVHIRDVIVQILHPNHTQSAPHLQKHKNEKTHRTNRKKQRLLPHRLLQTPLLTPPPPVITPTHRRPRPIHPSTAAAEQQVVVEFVFFCGGAAAADEGGGGAFDG